MGNKGTVAIAPRGHRVPEKNNEAPVRMPKKMLIVLEDERSLPRQLPVQRVATDGAAAGDRSGSNSSGKAVKETVANRRAVTSVNPHEPRNIVPAGRARGQGWRRLQLSIPVTGVAARAGRGRRDGTVRQSMSTTRETCPVRGRGPQPVCIRMNTENRTGPVPGVGGVHSSDESGESPRSEGTLVVSRLE